MRQFTFTISIFFAILIFTGVNQAVIGQSKWSLDPGGDFVSRYIWRGTDFGNSPAIQPSLELGYSGFVLGAWGSYSTNDANFQEADLFLSYTFKELVTLTVTDYFFPDGRIENNDYLNYESDSTGHVFEGMISFNGTEKIPLSLMVATNFAGADAKTADNKLQYSTYIELGYSTHVGETSLDVFLGGTPTKPDKDKGESGYYGPKAGIVNVGITGGRDIQITEKFALPIRVSLITNPVQKNVFFVFGISL
jgi:hypothetical protein